MFPTLSDELYWRRRAELEQRMVEAAAGPEARMIHETLRDANLRRAAAAGASAGAAE